MSVSLQAVVSLDHSAFSSGMSTLSRTVSNITGAMSMAFGGVASEVLAMSRAFGSVGGAVVALKEAVTAGASFEQQMANVSSVSGLMGDELRKVESAARDLAKTTRFTATEAGDALYSLASAGITGADALSNTLKPALLLAGATLSSTQMATEAVTAALANFQIPANEATRIADQFAGAIATSPATMERLSDAMKYAGPAAAGFGIALEKTVAEVAAFHQVGLRGEMAGTSFRMALVQLSQESVKAGSAVGEALKGWDASTEGITGAVRRLNAAGVDTADVIQALGARAGPGLAALMKFGANAMDELAARITNTADVSKMYETQLGTLTGRFAIFKSAIEEVWLKLYGALVPALTALVENMTAAIDWVGKLSDALFAGQWQAAGDQVAALWESIKAGAAAFDWIGLFDELQEIIGNLIGRIGEFGAQIMAQLGLTRTLDALKAAFETVRNAVNLLCGAASHLSRQMRDMSWADVARAAIKALDLALSLTVKTIDTALRAVVGLVNGWKSLSAETQTVLLAIVGTAGLVAGLVKVIAIIEAATKATVAFALAMKASLISHAETAYIKLLLLKDAILSVTAAQAGMVLGAAALGVGLGLLIRQIPGVADALDNLTVKVGQFLGLVEKEDETLKKNQEELRRRREAQSAAIISSKALEEQEKKNTAAMQEQLEVAGRLADEGAALEEAAYNAAAAQEAQAASATKATRSAADFTAGLRAQREAEINSLVSMRALAPASASLGDALEASSRKTAAAAEETGKLADETDAAKVSITDLYGMIAAFKEDGIDAFDVSAFVGSVKQLAAGLAGIVFPELKLPDFSKVSIPRLTQMETSSFVNALKQIATGLTGFQMPDLSGLTDLQFIKIPELSVSDVARFIGALQTLKTGLMNIDFGSLGRINVDIKGGDPATKRLDDIYTLLNNAKGIVWA